MISWLAVAVLSTLSFVMMVRYTATTIGNLTSKGDPKDIVVTAVMSIITGIIACFTWFGDVAWFVIKHLFRAGSNLNPGTSGTIILIVLLIVLAYVARFIRAKV